MIDFYPYIKSQEDLIAVVEAEYKTKTGRALPSLFIDRMLKSRRNTILNAMEEERTIKLDRLGKLVVTPSAKDKRDIIAALGEDFTYTKFKEELKNRANLGILNCQRYSKVNGRRRKKRKGKLSIFTISESNKE